MQGRDKDFRTAINHALRACLGPASEISSERNTPYLLCKIPDRSPDMPCTVSLSVQSSSQQAAVVFPELPLKPHHRIYSPSSPHLSPWRYTGTPRRHSRITSAVSRWPVLSSVLRLSQPTPQDTLTRSTRARSRPIRVFARGRGEERKSQLTSSDGSLTLCLRPKLKNDCPPPFIVGTVPFILKITVFVQVTVVLSLGALSVHKGLVTVRNTKWVPATDIRTTKNPTGQPGRRP